MLPGLPKALPKRSRTFQGPFRSAQDFQHSGALQGPARCLSATGLRPTKPACRAAPYSGGRGSTPTQQPHRKPTLQLRKQPNIASRLLTVPYMAWMVTYPAKHPHRKPTLHSERGATTQPRKDGPCFGLGVQHDLGCC